jgi:hypothetical protein
MSVEIEIRGHGGGITIDVLGYENPAATKASDANWLICSIRMRIGPVHGDMKASFTTQDFAEFARELRALVEGQASAASFQTDEQALELKIVGKPTGSAEITGTVRYSFGPDVAVSFTLDSEKSYLLPVIDAISSTMEQFPIRS